VAPADAVSWLRARPWLAIWPLLFAGGVVLLLRGDGSSFSGDDFYYYGREVLESDEHLRHFNSISLEYLFIPHNGHLQIGGKLLYELLFALAGPNYFWYRLVGVFAVLLCVGLFFVLARRRVGVPAALLGAVVLVFLGAAWEVLLWPFDIHTTLGTAAGLGALLAIESNTRRGNIAACALLVAGLCFIEVALVFLAIIAFILLTTPERRRSVWVVAVPAVLFGAWYLWARQYDFPTAQGEAADLIPNVFHSLQAVTAALTGLFPTGADTSPYAVARETISAIVAGVALVAFAVAVASGRVSRRGWALAFGLGGYWASIAIANREAEASRYMFVGCLLALLLLVEVLNKPPKRWALAGMALVVVVSLYSNLAKLGDGAGVLERDAQLTRGELAMIELAGTRGAPDYISAVDPLALGSGASPYLVSTTADYLRLAASRGSFAAPLDEVEGENVFLRRVFDVVLGRALGLELEPAEAPVDPDRCSAVPDPAVATQLPTSGALVRAEASGPVILSRFVADQPVLTIGTAEPGQWYRVALPGADEATAPWRLFLPSAGTVCPL
jgi:hypothetical protein